MKKILVLLLILALAESNFGQQIPPASKITKDQYLRKSKNQKTTAWILLGSGTLIIAGGIIGFSESTLDKADQYGWIMIAGVALDLASIPFFILSGKNKKRANAITANFQFERGMPNIQRGLALNYYPAISMKIQLR